MANDLASADMQQRQVAVVVVHGVGDAVPAAALNEVVSKLETNFAGQFKADRHSEVHQLASPAIISGDPDDTFPAHTRNATLTATGDRIRFYDLHWADLTKTLPGRMNAFLGTFRIIFEAHHFIDALLPRESGGVARLLRTLLLLAASILRGPIVGLSTFLVVIGLAFYAGWPYLSMILGEDRQGVGVMWFVIALLGATFAIASTVFFYRGHSRETEWNDVLITIIYGSVFVGLYILYNAYPLLKNEVSVAANFRRCDSIEFIYSAIQIFRATWCLLLLLTIPLVAWLYLSSLFKQTAVRPSAGAAALSVVILQSALWLALISAFAIPLIKEAALRHDLAVFRGESNVIETCNLEGLYISAAGTFVLLMIVTLVGSLTYLARSILSRLPFVDLKRRATLTPRMLLGRGVTMAGLLGLVVQIIFFMMSWGNAFEELSRGVTSEHVKEGLQKSEAALQSVANNVYPLAAALVLLVSVLVSFASTTGIHIARDLIDHQYSPRRGFAHYLLPMRWPEGPDRPRRKRIRERLNTLARELICKEGFHDLVFVVHSQGSVVVYDFLRAGGDECDQLLDVRPHMITMGSPLGHLYGFYFKEYAGIDAGIARVCGRLGSWTNLYRVDDSIGRHVGDAGGRIENRIMPAGGHRNYWRERIVSEVIFARIRGNADTSTAAMETQVQPARV